MPLLMDTFVDVQVHESGLDFSGGFELSVQARRAANHRC